MYNRWNDPETRARAAEREAEDLRYQLEREQRKQQEQHEARMNEMRERHREYETTANGWAEAFAKGLPRYRREAIEETKLNAEMRNDSELAKYANDEGWFANQVIEIEFALGVYNEETAKITDQITHIREHADILIAALEQQVRDEVARRVNEHFEYETHIGEALHNDDYEFLVNW